MTKDEIRLKLKEQRNSIPLQEQEDLSSVLRKRLFETEAYKKCNKIFTYLSFRSEVDTKEIICQAIKDGKKLYIPRVDRGDMDFYQIHDFNSLILSNYGILEPPQEERNRYHKSQTFRKAEPEDASIKDKITGNAKDYIYSRLMLLPGLAFDLASNRIGYGAGYYDRYLSTFGEEHFYKIALAYDFQVLDQITAEEFDIKTNAILTPTRFIACSNTHF